MGIEIEAKSQTQMDGIGNTASNRRGAPVKALGLELLTVIPRPASKMDSAVGAMFCAFATLGACLALVGVALLDSGIRRVMEDSSEALRSPVLRENFELGGGLLILSLAGSFLCFALARSYLRRDRPYRRSGACGVPDRRKSGQAAGLEPT